MKGRPLIRLGEHLEQGLSRRLRTRDDRAASHQEIGHGHETGVRSAAWRSVFQIKPAATMLGTIVFASGDMTMPARCPSSSRRMLSHRSIEQCRGPKRGFWMLSTAIAIASSAQHARPILRAVVASTHWRLRISEFGIATDACSTGAIDRASAGRAGRRDDGALRKPN